MNTLSLDSFNFKQMFQNSKGKSSPMLVCAFYGAVSSVTLFVFTGFITLILVIHGTKTEVTSILNSTQMQCVAMFTVCAGMLVSRRFSNDKELKIDTENGN